MDNPYRKALKGFIINCFSMTVIVGGICFIIEEISYGNTMSLTIPAFCIMELMFLLVGYSNYQDDIEINKHNIKLNSATLSPDPITYRCDRCGKEYKTKVGYLNHMKNNHFPEKDRLEYDSHTNWKKGLYLVSKVVEQSQRKRLEINGIRTYLYRSTPKKELFGLYLIPKGIIVPCEYDWISKFDNNSALLILNEKEGLCSIKTGKIRIPCEYQEIHHIKGNYFIVKLNNKYGIIEASLKEKERVIFDCKYDKIEDVGGNYVLLLLRGLYGAANFKTGELRFDCKYENYEIEKHLKTDIIIHSGAFVGTDFCESDEKGATRAEIEKDLIKRIKGIQKILKIKDTFKFQGFVIETYNMALKEGNIQKIRMSFAVMCYVDYLYIKENNIAKPSQKKLRKIAIDALAVPDFVPSDKHDKLTKLIGARIEEYRNSINLLKNIGI